MKFTSALGCAFTLMMAGCSQNQSKAPIAPSNAIDSQPPAVAATISGEPAAAVPEIPSSPAPAATPPQSVAGNTAGEPIDLKGRYLVPIEKLIKSERFPWRDVPRGTTTLGNVPLQIDGFICLWGSANAERGMVYPETVDGIPVARKFDAFYLYHTTFFGASDGTPVAKLIFRYQDGTFAENEICFGTHVRDWWQDPAGPKELTDLKSKLVWSAANSMAPANRPNQLQFFITEITNPHPEFEVATIDLASLKATPALCIMAMTTGPEGLLNVESKADDKPNE